MTEFLIFDVPAIDTVGTGAGIAAAFALIFFGAMALAAYIAYRAMMRTVKTTIRLVITGAIILIALFGAVFLYFYSQTPAPRDRPAPQRKR